MHYKVSDVIPGVKETVRNKIEGALLSKRQHSKMNGDKK